MFKRCNKYIDETEPWVLAKDDAKKDRLATVLYNLTESIVIGASILEPFMPETAQQIAKELNTTIREFTKLSEFGLYPNGNKVSEAPEMLFKRKDLEEVLKQTEEITRLQKEDFIKTQTIAAENLEKAGKIQDAEKIRENLKAVTGQSTEESEEVVDIEAKPEITFDQFGAMQFQVGEVIKCEAVPKSKKLLCSQVKVGSRTLQIVSGIRKYYEPEEMVGKKVMVLVNLKPAKLAGVMSEGMLLCAEGADGELSLMVPEKKMPSGAEIA